VQGVGGLLENMNHKSYLVYHRIEFIQEKDLFPNFTLNSNYNISDINGIKFSFVN
jgi:hypothetical protein